jgi:hypothetical protein
MRQIDGHVHRGDGVLGQLVAVTNAERKADIFDANAINGDLAVIAFILRIFKRGHGEIKIPTAAVSNSGKGEFYVTAAAESRQEVNGTGALYFACHFAVQPSWQTSNAAGNEFTRFAQEALE